MYGEYTLYNFFYKIRKNSISKKYKGGGKRDETKKSATDNLSLCSKMAEELIVLRDKLDKFYHNSNK